MPSTEAARRLCLVIDRESYSNLSSNSQLLTQTRLLQIINGALTVAGIDMTKTSRQDQGDGVLLVLPAAVDESLVIPAFIRGLEQLLRQANTAHSDRIRLRIALSAGTVRFATNGFAGSSILEASRLLDSMQMRAILREYPDIDLAVIISDSLFMDSIATGQGTRFQPVDVDIPSKRFSARGWIYTPHESDARFSAERDEIKAIPRLSERVLVAAAGAYPGDAPTSSSAGPASGPGHEEPDAHIPLSRSESTEDASLHTNKIDSSVHVHLENFTQVDPDVIPVLIYLQNGKSHEKVEHAIHSILVALDYVIDRSSPPIRGSWLKFLRGRTREAVHSERTPEVYAEIRRAVELQGLHIPQAKVDEQKGTTAAKLIESIQGEERAVILIGSILLLKDDGILAVRELTQGELIQLQKNPGLFRDPVRLLSTLQEIADGADSKMLAIQHDAKRENFGNREASEDS